VWGSGRQRRAVNHHVVLATQPDDLKGPSVVGMMSVALLRSADGAGTLLQSSTTYRIPHPALRANLLGIVAVVILPPSPAAFTLSEPPLLFSDAFGIFGTPLLRVVRPATPTCAAIAVSIRPKIEALQRQSSTALVAVFHG